MDEKILIKCIENKKTLAGELRRMSELKGEYECFEGVVTPLVRAIWDLAACYLEED